MSKIKIQFMQIIFNQINYLFKKITDKKYITKMYLKATKIMINYKNGSDKVYQLERPIN